MNTQGQHENSKKAHAINHVGTEKVAKRIKRTAGKVARKVRTLEGRASSMIDKGEDRVVSAAKGMTDWVSENPKAAIGALVGTGLLIGLLGASRFGRATLFGLTGLAAAAIKRFV